MSQLDSTAIDPVCGMTVEIDKAVGAGLTSEHNGVTYYFCGKGCKLDFGEDPARYLDPGNAPAI
jgi:YHS domain-containing protein